MIILTWDDTDKIKILINGFLVNNQLRSKESISIDFLNYLRQEDVKIEDGTLINEIYDQIEKKLG